MALKRRVLEELLKFLMTKRSRRLTEFEIYVASHPLARDYAVFRAKIERERKSWLHWPGAGRDGTLTSEDYDESAYHYHLYVQWQCDEQTRRLRDQDKGSRHGALSRLSPRGQSRRITMSGASASSLP